jgi:hypothetical protein
MKNALISNTKAAIGKLLMRFLSYWGQMRLMKTSSVHLSSFPWFYNSNRETVFSRIQCRLYNRKVPDIQFKSKTSKETNSPVPWTTRHCDRSLEMGRKIVNIHRRSSGNTKYPYNQGILQTIEQALILPTNQEPKWIKGDSRTRARPLSKRECYRQRMKIL